MLLTGAVRALTGAVRALTGAGNDKQIIKMTYPKIDAKNDFDSHRNKVNDELKSKAREMAKNYLKDHNINAPSLKKYSGTNEDVLDKVAYAALQKYSVTINGITTDYTPPEQKGTLPIDTLSKLVGGWFENGVDSNVVGGFHKRGSVIGDEEVKVIFYFNFEKSKDNKDLLIWQGKLTAPPPPNPHPVVANKNDKLVRIKTATPMLFTLSDGRSFSTFDWLKIYPDEKLGSRAEIFHTNDLRYNPTNGGQFYPWQRDELQRSYVDTSQINSSRAWVVTGGRKSTRRRQRRSNTRRIKQMKQSRKNHTRRRKTIRK